MDEQTNSYPSQSMPIQLAVVSEASQVEDIADIDEVSRDLVERLREDGYTATFPMTISEARTKAGSPIFEILIEIPKFLHDNKDLLLKIFDSISLVLQCILIAHDKRAKQEKEVRTLFTITLKINGKPITIETPDTKNASALIERILSAFSNEAKKLNQKAVYKLTSTYRLRNVIEDVSTHVNKEVSYHVYF